MLQEYSLEVSLMMTKVTKALAKFKEEAPQFAEKIDAIADMVRIAEVVSLDEEE